MILLAAVDAYSMVASIFFVVRFFSKGRSCSWLKKAPANTSPAPVASTICSGTTCVAGVNNLVPWK